MDINNIHSLGEIITDKLNNNIKLYDLKNILLLYNGIDWTTFVEFKKNTYNKIQVYKNNIIEIFIICWNIGQFTQIHDHPSNGCLVKILDGQLYEYRYSNISENIEEINKHILNKNSISYMSGNNILHKISNECHECAISIHIYNPPNYIPLTYTKY